MNYIKKMCLLTLCVIYFFNAGAQTEATYYTTKGKFKVMLTDTLTPRTVDSFIARVSEKFYDGLIFHRVIDSFMIQGGDPLGTGYGGPGYTMPDEFNSTLKNIPGALAMANSGPNTNGCQFFINLVTNSHLDNHFTVFGMVTDSFSVVQTIGHVSTDANDRPLTPVVIDSIRITKIHTAGVGNIANQVAANIYPNPGRGVVNIDLPNIATKVEIVNIQGQSVYTKTAKGSLIVDLREQPTGLYFVRLSNLNGTYESRLIVQ